MAACRSKDRDFLPSLENYFEEAIEQLDPSVESQFKYAYRMLNVYRIFQHFLCFSVDVWMMLTSGGEPYVYLQEEACTSLLTATLQSLSFQTIWKHMSKSWPRIFRWTQILAVRLERDYSSASSGVPFFVTRPTYVACILKQLSSASSANVKSEPVDEGTEVEPLESENEPVAATSEADVSPEDSSSKAEETMESMETGPVSKKSQLCTIDQMNRLGERLGSKWKLLARKLGCEDDQVSMFLILLDLLRNEPKWLNLIVASVFVVWL